MKNDLTRKPRPYKPFGFSRQFIIFVFIPILLWQNK